MASESSKILEFALLQVAAESYLDQIDSNAGIDIRDLLQAGSNRPESIGQSFDSPILPGATRMTRRQADWFLSNFEVVVHYPNDASGFSATLFRDRRSGAFTLSFRSTEYQFQSKGGDYERDGADGADGDISRYGFALAQLSSMEAFYEHLRRGEVWRDGAWVPDAAVAAFADASPVLNVTGYSLGAHLAAAFTLMHGEDVQATWLYNAAGLGGISTAGNDNAIPLGRDISRLVSTYRALMDVGDGSINDNPFWSSLIDGTPLMGDYLDAAAAARGMVYDNVYDNPLHRVVMNVLAPQMYPAGGGSVPILGDGMGNTRFIDAMANFDRDVLNSFSSNLYEVPPVDPWSKIRQFYGHGEFLDMEVVANSGWHVAPTRVFIEDIPLSRGWGLIELVASRTRDVVKDFGESHSITPIIDSLTVLDMLQQIDASVDMTRFAWLARASANSEYSFDNVLLGDIVRSIAAVPIGLLGNGVLAHLLNDRIYDVDALENIVNAIHRIVLGRDAGLKPATDEALVADGYGNLEERSRLHDAIAAVNEAVAGLRQQGRLLGIRMIGDIGEDEIVAAALANDDSGRAWRYALRSLNPFVLLGADYSVFNAAGELDIAGEGGDGVLTTAWVRSRAELLGWKIKFDTGIEESRGLGEFARGNIPYADRPESAFVEGRRTYSDEATLDQQGRTLAMTIGETGRVIAERVAFGSSGSDEVFGSDLRDRLHGEAGDDLLNGFLGDDVLDGGSGDDRYVALSERDQVVDGRGIDRYEITGHAQLSITDFDGRGSIEWDGVPLATVIQQTTDAWANGLPPDGAIFRDVDRRFTVVVDGRDLVILNSDHPGASVTLRQFVLSTPSTTLSIDLVRPGEDAASTTFVGSSTGDTVYVGATDPNSATAAWTRAEWVRTLDGSDFIQIDPVDLGPTRIDAGPGNDVVTFATVAADAAASALEGLVVRAGDGDDALLPWRIRPTGDNDVAVPGDGGRMYGEGGNDLFEGSGKPEFFDGGSGHDNGQGGAGSDTLIGGGGNDWLSGDEGSDVLAGGAGDDRLMGGERADVLLGGAGSDLLYGDATSNIVDMLAGQAGWTGTSVRWFDVHHTIGVRDVDYALIESTDDAGGNDDLRGGDGDDSLFGGVGDDLLDGGAGRDYLAGEAGDDILDGGDGDDVLVGDKLDQDYAADMEAVHFKLNQTDESSGAILATTVIHWRRHGDGPDVAGDDRLSGGAGSDRLIGGRGDDELDGGAGRDFLHGGEDNDRLDGGTGNDGLYGGDGDDVYRGGGGDDTLVDPSGSDSYYFAAGWGDDSIDDWDGRGQILIDRPLGAVDLQRQGKALVITAGSDRLTVRNWFDGNALDAILFSDGQLSRAAVDERLLSITGTEDGEVLIGAAEVGDFIHGAGGADRIMGMGGNDRLDGGEGDDIIDGGDGDDELLAGGGNDQLIGGLGADRYLTGTGHVSIRDEGSDRMSSRVRLPAGISLNGLSALRLGNDLKLTHAAGSVTIGDYYVTPGLWIIETADGAVVDPATLARSALDDAAWVRAVWNARLDNASATMQAAIRETERWAGWSRSDFGALGFTVAANRRSGSATVDGSQPEYGAFYLSRDESGQPLLDEQGNAYVLLWYDPAAPAPAGAVTRTSWPDIWIVEATRMDLYQAGGSGDDVIWSVADQRFDYRGRQSMWAVLGAPTGSRDSNGALAVTRRVTGLLATPSAVGADLSPFDGGSGYRIEIDVYSQQLGVNVIDAGDGNDRVNDMMYGWTDWQYDPMRQSWQPVYPLFDGVPGEWRDPLLADGGNGDDVLYGRLADDTLRGGAGNDRIHGESGDDVMAGEGGADRLEGGDGADFYLIGADDDGVDVIIDHGTFTPLGFPGYEDIEAELHRRAFGDVMAFNLPSTDVAVQRFEWGGGRMALAFSWMHAGQRHAAVSVLAGAGEAAGFGVDTYRFIDRDFRAEELLSMATQADLGVVVPIGQLDLDRDGVLAGTSIDDDIDHRRWPVPYDPRVGGGLRIAAGAGDDRVVAGDRADDIDSGTGNDWLSGGGGRDVYRFSVGDGIDTVIDTADADGDNEIRFADGVDRRSIRLERTAEMLRIHYGGLGDEVRIPGFNPVSPAPAFQSLHFADGSTMSLRNVAPRIGTAIPAMRAVEDLSFSLAIPADAFVDPDGEPVQLSVTRADGSPLPGWLTFDRDTRMLHGVPQNDDVGTLLLRVTASDAAGETATQTVTLVVDNTNDTPVVVSPLPDQRAREGEPFVYSVGREAFADVDVGDALVLAARLDDGGPLPEWLRFDPLTTTLAGTPPLDAAGVLDIRIVAVDSAGSETSDVLRLTIDAVGRVLVGTTGDDTLVGGSGDDTIDGMAGSDVLRGGRGNDTLQFTRDATWGVASVSNVGSPGVAGSGEAAVSLAGKSRSLDWFDGGGGTDRLLGTAAGDVVVLDAGEATPRVIGIEIFDMGDGDDVVDLASTRFDYGPVSMDGGRGNDVLWSGAGADRLFGGDGNDRLTGGAGNDYLDGGPGVDAMRGGPGDDTYVVDSTADALYENAGQGLDTVLSAVSRTLPGNFEYLFLTGPGAANATGNALDNWLRGNAAANQMLGQGGNDTLWGDGGNDVLNGDAGIDILQGGAGNDVLADASGNGLLDGGDGDDTLTGGNAREFHAGGRGNDIVETGTGQDVIAFNRGDGADTVGASAGSDNTLSLGGGIDYADLVLNRSGLDLILGTGNGDRITFRNWYQRGGNYRSVVTLQMVADAMSGYGAASADPLRRQRVTRFDFLGIVSAFDTARVANPALTNWAVSNALAAAWLGGSDDAALGGDLAYQYGHTGSLAGIGAGAAQSILGQGSFASTTQRLQSADVLQSGTIRLG